MVTEAAENNGPMIFARMGVMKAIHRHHVRVFDTSRKPHHCGKRKLKRDVARRKPTRDQGLPSRPMRSATS